MVAEEAVAAGRIPQVARMFWLVDPLDGTKEFINRNGEFTVNVALIEDGRRRSASSSPPRWAGCWPAAPRSARGPNGPAGGARSPAGAPAEGLTVVASRSHGDNAALDAFLAGRKVAAISGAGSSLKLCMVAQGEADVYPRLGRTMEWDIAAGHAVLGAPAVASPPVGRELRYGKPGFENPHFIARAWPTDPAPRAGGGSASKHANSTTTYTFAALTI